MKVKCIKTFLVERYDDDGFAIENKHVFVRENSKWIVKDSSFRVIDGEVRLTRDRKNSNTWLEIPKETFEEHFKEIEEVKK